MGIGPEIPIHLLKQPPPPTRKVEEEEEEGSDDDGDSDYTPDLPPELVKQRQEPTTVKVVAGPQLPPHLVSSSTSSSSSRPTHPHPQPDDDDADDEEDFGPGPLPLARSNTNKDVDDDDNDGAKAFLEREERQREKERLEKEASENKKMKREEWMLVPPKEMDLLSTMDPTKLKSRSFISGPKAQKSTRPQDDGGVNLWTETPLERQQRLQDEALGKKRKAENANPDDELEDSEEARRKRARDLKLKQEVERHNSKSRNKSLVEQHEKKSGKGKDKKGGDDESTGWDRDRDMSIGGRLIDDGKRKQMIKHAKGLGGRFGSSGFM